MPIGKARDATTYVMVYRQKVRLTSTQCTNLYDEHDDNDNPVFPYERPISVLGRRTI